MTIVRNFGRLMARRTIVFVLAAAAILLGHWLATVTPHPAAEFPNPDGDYLTAVIAAHDCWSGPAPADVKRPGHVVVTLGDSDKPVYSRLLVGPALDKVFGTPKPGAQVMTVRAFCR